MSDMNCLSLYGDGINDDTTAIQQQLDSRNATVYLPPPAEHYVISRTLHLHSNQALVLDRFTMIRLAPLSDCLMLSTDDLMQKRENISVTGGIWFFDNTNQTPNPLAIPPAINPFVYILGEKLDFYQDFYMGVVMRFANVKNLTLRSMTIKDPTTFCVQMSRMYQFSVDDITFDFNHGNPIPGNMDGIHLDGDCRFGHITNLKGTCYDDMVALNADDCYWGPIEDITIDGLYSEGCHSAVRMLSTGSNLRRISIANVYGTYYQYGIGLTRCFHDRGVTGQYDQISLRNIYATKAPRLAMFQKEDHPVFPIVWTEKGIHVGILSIDNMHRREDCTGVECISIAKGVQVDCMTVTNSSYENLTTDHAAMIGNDGDIGALYLYGIHVKGEPVLDNRGSISKLVTDGTVQEPAPSLPPTAKPRWTYA